MPWVRRVAVVAMASLFVAACSAARSPDRRMGEGHDGVSPSATPAWIDAVSRACALAASCAHLHDGRRAIDPGACVDFWVSHEGLGAGPEAERQSVHRCLLAASTCEAIDACTRERGDARAAAFCVAHRGRVTGCDGDRLVTCTGDDVNESRSVDCAALSAHCGETSLPGGLVARGCFSAALCPATAPEARCDGAAAVLSCHDGAVERVACRRDARCEEHTDADGERAASCETPAEARCMHPGARSCDGDRLVMCEPRGHYGALRATDCAAMGLRCADRGGRAACMRSAGEGRASCEPGAARCDGDALTFCAAGTMARVSCASLGLGACDPDARGARAACSGRR